MSILSVPLEVFDNIISHDDVTKQDLKNLRVAHPRFALWAVNYKDWEEVRFDFCSSSDSSEAYAKAAARRMRNVMDLKGSYVASIPQCFSVRIGQIPPAGFKRFADAYSKNFRALLDTFHNIRDVRVEVDMSDVLRKDIKQLSKIVASHTSGFALRLSCNLETIMRIGILRDSKTLLASSSRVTELELRNYGLLVSSVLEQPPEVLSSIRSLSIRQDDVRDGSVYYTQCGYITPNIIRNLTSLKSLELLPSPVLLNGVSVWSELEKSDFISLESVTVGRVSKEIFSYLASVNAHYIRDVKISAGVVRDRRGNYCWPDQHAANIFFESALPNIQHTIINLELVLLPYFPRRDIHTGDAIHFNFVERGVEYTFPVLETLSVGMGYEPGCFHGFMKTIRNAPNLRHIELVVEVRTRDHGRGEDLIMNDIRDYRFGNGVMTAGRGTTMNVTVLVISDRRIEEVSVEYEMKSDGWSYLEGSDRSPKIE